MKKRPSHDTETCPCDDCYRTRWRGPRCERCLCSLPNHSTSCARLTEIESLPAPMIERAARVIAADWYVGRSFDSLGPFEIDAAWSVARRAITAALNSGAA